MLFINLVDPASSHTLVSEIKPCMQCRLADCGELIITVIMFTATNPRKTVVILRLRRERQCRGLLESRKLNTMICGNASSAVLVSDLSASRQGLGLPRRLRVTGNEGSIPEKEPERRLLHLRVAAGA